MRVFQAATVQPHVDLDGRALPAPARRLVAIAVDVLLLAVPSLLIALTAAVVAMAVRHPAAFDALRTLIATAPEEGSPEANRLIGELAPFLVQVNAEGVPPAAVAAVEEGDVARAGELLSGIPIRSSSATSPVRDDAIEMDADRTGRSPGCSISGASRTGAWRTIGC